MKKIKINPLLIFLIFLIIGVFVGISRLNKPLISFEVSGVVERTLDIIDKNGLKNLSEEQKKKLKIAAMIGFLKEFRKIDPYATISIKNNKLTINKEATPARKQSFISNIIINEIYITKISDFNYPIEEKIKRLLKKNKKIKTIVFDLRDNYGGFILNASRLLDLFLPPGENIIFTKTKRASGYITRSPAFLKHKIFVLINSRTASAAEIFADVIQRTKRGVVIGTPSFGKNLTQSDFYKIKDGFKISITTSELKYQSGKNKIVPDILVKENEDALRVALEYIEGHK